MEIGFEQIVSASVDEVFAFHADPGNLGRLLEGWRGFRLMHHDGTIEAGSEVWFEQSVAGCIPVVMGFRHTVYEPPHRFGEEMIHGPFSRFEHLHDFETSGDGCLVCDRLNVELPWQYGGELTVRMYVAPAIRRVFAHRSAALDRLAREGFGPIAQEQLAG